VCEGAVQNAAEAVRAIARAILNILAFTAAPGGALATAAVHTGVLVRASGAPARLL